MKAGIFRGKAIIVAGGKLFRPTFLLQGWPQKEIDFARKRNYCDIDRALSRRKGPVATGLYLDPYLDGKDPWIGQHCCRKYLPGYWPFPT
jgi:hypothetical protein